MRNWLGIAWFIEGARKAVHIVSSHDDPPKAVIDFDLFSKVDIRIGTIASAEVAEGVRKPAIKLSIDFGPGIGLKKSCAQITAHYQPAELIGRQVAAVVNFPPRQIGKLISEVLTLGFADEAGEVVLFSPDQRVPNGSHLF
jgi:tRNA-binding protein